MATKLKERASFFSAGEQEIIINTYEEYKTIIMATSNTATAARERQEAVFGRIFMYVYVMKSTTVVQGVKKLFSNCKVASSITLISLPSILLHFFVSRFE